MTALCVRGRTAQSALHWLSAALVLVAVGSQALADEPNIKAMPAPMPPSDAPIVVAVDQATVMKLPERATTVVIGNPLIADLTIQPGGIAIVTGKGFGATNVIVMDRGGAVLSEKLIEVKGPNEPVVVVYRGLSRQTYSCTPECSPRITLGDTSKDDMDKDSGLPSDYFGKTLNQTITRNNQAMAIGGSH
jgi:Flp pilus assembly secretin CpaC